MALSKPTGKLAFAYQSIAILEAARKQDEALIQQLVEAMEGVKALNMGGELALWTAEFDRLLSAITAARAGLLAEIGRLNP